jgi:hypothetical protein
MAPALVPKAKLKSPQAAASADAAPLARLGPPSKQTAAASAGMVTAGLMACAQIRVNVPLPSAHATIQAQEIVTSVLNRRSEAEAETVLAL